MRPAGNFGFETPTVRVSTKVQVNFIKLASHLNAFVGSKKVYLKTRLSLKYFLWVLIAFELQSL